MNHDCVGNTRYATEFIHLYYKKINEARKTKSLPKLGKFAPQP
jgi:hypothetical protein